MILNSPLLPVNHVISQAKNFFGEIANEFISFTNGDITYRNDLDTVSQNERRTDSKKNNLWPMPANAINSAALSWIILSLLGRLDLQQRKYKRFVGSILIMRLELLGQAQILTRGFFRISNSIPAHNVVKGKHGMVKRDLGFGSLGAIRGNVVRIDNLKASVLESVTNE